jgi:hypothetical protein
MAISLSRRRVAIQPKGSISIGDGVVNIAVGSRIARLDNRAALRSFRGSFGSAATGTTSNHTERVIGRQSSAAGRTEGDEVGGLGTIGVIEVLLESDHGGSGHFAFFKTGLKLLLQACNLCHQIRLLFLQVVDGVNQGSLLHQVLTDNVAKEIIVISKKGVLAKIDASEWRGSFGTAAC